MKLARLAKSKDVTAVSKHGLRRGNALVGVSVLLTDLGSVRFTVSASKSTGNAVVRNRAKRRLRALGTACLLKEKASFNAASSTPLSVDVMLVARARTATAPAPELKLAVTAAITNTVRAAYTTAPPAVRP